MLKYLNPKRPAARKEFWITILVLFLANMLLFYPVYILALSMEATPLFQTAIVPLFTFIRAVLAVIAVIAVIRRCRDAGISPWWTLAAFVPCFELAPFLDHAFGWFVLHFGLFHIGFGLAWAGFKLVQFGCFIAIGCLKTKSPLAAPSQD